MLSKRVLAFDLGVSCGRAVIGSYDGKQLQLDEIHRFSNDPVSACGVVQWDILRLLREMKLAISKAMLSGGFDAIGIDSWEADFGLIDRYGHLLANPVHYRGSLPAGVTDTVFKAVSPEDFFRKTGNLSVSYNTIFQLAHLRLSQPELLDLADKALLIPDLLAYMLTGVCRAEYTGATTTQCFDPKAGDWAYDLLDKLDIPCQLFAPVINSGEAYGLLSDDLCSELGAPKVPVVAVATHDNASAVAAVPTDKEDFIFINSGLYSLFGTELSAPVITGDAYGYELTNEGGFGRTMRLVKTLMGQWLIQECRRQWLRQGYNLSYADLETKAQEAEPLRSFINPLSEEFSASGDLPRQIQDFCRRTGQPVPATKGEIMRCVYDSLAMQYRRTYGILAEVTGKHYQVIHIIGSGKKDRLLCQLTADACGTAVIAGPADAIAAGNCVAQLVHLGVFKTHKAARKAIAAGEHPQVYRPANTAAYEEAFTGYLSIL